MSTMNRTGSSLLGARARTAAKAQAPAVPVRVTAPGPVPATAATLNALQAFQAMEAGVIVRRIAQDGTAAKYHRIHAGQVESADSEHALAMGNWHPTKTDVANWYASTFRRIKVKVVHVDYE